MKKIAMNILYGLLCAAAMAGSAFLGVKLAYDHMIAARYDHFKVNFTEDVGTTIKDLTYGDDPLQNYDIYLPADNSKENYSLVFFIHGGGFTGGDKALIEAQRYGEYLASKGYVMVSANYRLATEDNGVCVLDMYNDLLIALDTSIQKCEELGYHLNEMATTGGSAGGCLAMLVAFKQPDKLLLPLKFIFEETGPASFEPELWDMQTDDEKAYFVNSVSGKSFTAEDVGSEEYQNGIDEISAATMITEDTVPILLAYGTEDKVVNVKAKFPLLEALDKNGVEHTYIEFPHSGHGLNADPDKLAEYYQATDEYLDKYMPVK